MTFYVRDDLNFAEFNVEEATGDIIDDAVYKRNQTVSERLGVIASKLPAFEAGLEKLLEKFK